MALQALRLLLLAASFTHVTAQFYGVVFFNEDGNVNWLTTGVVDSILIFAGALIFFWRMGRRAERAERLTRDPIYMGNVSIRNVSAATSSLVNNDGAELTSYAAMTMDTYATKIPDGVLPGQTFAKMTESGKAIIKVPTGAQPGQTLQVTVPKPRVDTYTATVPEGKKPGQGFYLGTDLGRVWIKIPAGTKAGDTVEAKIPIEVNASTIAEVVEVKLVAGR